MLWREIKIKGAMVCWGNQHSKLTVHLLMEMVILMMGPRCFKEELKQYGLSSAEWLKECALFSKDWKINLPYFHWLCLLAEHRSGGCDSDNFAGIYHLCCSLVILPWDWKILDKSFVCILSVCSNAGMHVFFHCFCFLKYFLKIC